MRSKLSSGLPPILPMAIVLGTFVILPLCAQTSPDVPPVPVAPDQIKLDEDQIRAVVDKLFEDFRSRDAKGVVSCFVSKLPDYYTLLINPNFSPAADSKTPDIDALLHEVFMTKMAPLVQKSPTLEAFIGNILNPNTKNVFADQKASDFLAGIQVNGDSAVAVGKTSIKRMPLEFTFSRENGVWKIDPFPLFDNLEVVIAFDQIKHQRTPKQEADFYVEKMGNFDLSGSDSTPAADGSKTASPAAPAPPPAAPTASATH